MISIRQLNAFVCLFIMISCTDPSSEYTSHGQAIDREQVQSIDEVLLSAGNLENSPVKISAEIDEVCQKKGCWMTLKSKDGQSVRVTFKDYAFFVPKDAAGRRVILQGQATTKTLDTETAKHYAADAGRELTESELLDLKEISIIASGVLIEKNQL